MLNIKKLLLIPVVAIACLFTRIDSAFAVDYPFSLTTSSISSGGTFQFNLSAQGTFYVDCGTGGTLSSANSTANAMISGGTINKTDTTQYTFKCTYSSAGTKTIRFGGTATNYNTSTSTAAISFYTSDANAALITSISGNLSTIFPYISSSSGYYPTFYRTFRKATNLQSIPGTLFSGYTTGASHMFDSTFLSCKGLTSISADLFKNITTGAGSMFAGTFQACSGLTSIPGDLFKNITTGAGGMFSGTFQNCTGLTSIPANLFSNITTGATSLFFNTFSGCTNLTGTVPWTLFSGLIENGSPTATNMMLGVFSNTGLSMTCPSGKIQYKTGYESEWSGKVACGDPISCASGKYLPAGSTTCNASCPSGYSCPAGTVGRNMKSDENKYAPITLTWDGANASPASCNVGGTFVPPTPTRPGYIFAGWRQTCASKIRNIDIGPGVIAYGYTRLDGTAGFNESNYGLTVGSGQWAVEYGNGTVWGMANCNNTNGTNIVVGTPDTLVSGQYCWCQATGFTASGNGYTSGPKCTISASNKWVKSNVNYTTVDSCETSCVGMCANSPNSSDGLRTAIFNAAGQ